MRWINPYSPRVFENSKILSPERSCQRFDWRSSSSADVTLRTEGTPSRACGWRPCALASLPFWMSRVCQGSLLHRVPCIRYQGPKRPTWSWYLLCWCQRAVTHVPLLPFDLSNKDCSLLTHSMVIAKDLMTHLARPISGILESGPQSLE